METNSESYFPISYFPKDLKNIFEGIFIPPEEPKYPEKPKDLKKVKFDPTLVFFPVVSIFLLNFEFYNFGYFFLTISFVLYILFFSEKISFIRKSKIYLEDIKKYEKNKIEYLIKLENYENKFLKVKNNEEFNKNVIQFYLSETKKFNLESYAKKGKSELFFHKYLTDFFKDQIFTNKSIEEFLIFETSRNLGKFRFEDGIASLSYTPDFIFFNKETNLHIDIEIDEPYHNSTPIHFKNNPKDIERNNYFIQKKWVVIRFCEEQILLQPIACCYYIAIAISKITLDKSYLILFNNYNKEFLTLKKIKQWSFSEAKEMILNDSRNNYGKNKGGIVNIF